MTDGFEQTEEALVEPKEESEETKAARDVPQYYAFVAVQGEVGGLTYITAKTWQELNDSVERHGLTVHKIVKGREIGFCTKLVIAPK